MAGDEALTIKKIAALANVSTGTVSNTYSGKRPVAKATRQRVLRVARELGYSAHGPASALAAGKSRVLGVVPATVGTPTLDAWGSALVQGFCQRLSIENYNVVVLARDTSLGVPRMVAGRWVDGAAFLVRPDTRVLTWMIERSIPCVVLDAEAPHGLDTDSVYPDDAQGVRQAIEHLASLGHRRIAYINRAGPKGHALSIRTRLDSFRKTMTDLGLEALPGSELQISVEERARSLLAKTPPTAFLCYNDDMALATLQCLYARGLRVPQDVSVMGIDDLENARLASPALSSVHVPFEEIGKRAAELLLLRIPEPDRPFQCVKLPETLVLRDSSGPVAASPGQSHEWSGTSGRIHSGERTDAR
ncbi:MAG: LacI family DNA-binding transcriptional regulator [Planctomycetota bacterium]